MKKPSRAEINAQNAQFSTGPRTARGKAASSQNAIKHGLTASKPVVLAGEESDYEKFRKSLWMECEPEGTPEEDLFDNLVHASWKMRRIRRIEDKIESSADGEAILDPKLESDLTTLARHFARAERSYHRSLNQLKQLQTERMCRWQLPEEQAECLAALASAAKVAKQTHLKWPTGASKAAVSLIEVFKEVFLVDNLKNEAATQASAAAQAARRAPPCSSTAPFQNMPILEVSPNPQPLIHNGRRT